MLTEMYLVQKLMLGAYTLILTVSNQAYFSSWSSFSVFIGALQIVSEISICMLC